MLPGRHADRATSKPISAPVAWSILTLRSGQALLARNIAQSAMPYLAQWRNLRYTMPPAVNMIKDDDTAQHSYNFNTR